MFLKAPSPVPFPAGFGALDHQAPDEKTLSILELVARIRKVKLPPRKSDEIRASSKHRPSTIPASSKHHPSTMTIKICFKILLRLAGSHPLHPQETEKIPSHTPYPGAASSSLLGRLTGQNPAFFLAVSSCRVRGSPWRTRDHHGPIPRSLGIRFRTFRR